jgi:hypothetical protein
MTRNHLVLGLFLSGFALMIIGPLLVIGGFGSYSIYRDEVAEPIAKQKVPEVKNEFHQIPALAGAIATTNDGFTFDPQHLTEGRLYRTNSSYSEIRTHYDTELSKLGWKFDREADVNGVDGKNHGGKQVLYSKGEFRARLYHKGAETQYGYNYYFCVTWDY